MLSRVPLPAVPVVVFDYLAAPHREREVHDVGWYWGLLEGIRRGRQQRDDETEQSWAVMAERIRRQGGPFARSFSQLCNERGEQTRAAAARVHEHRILAGVDADA